MLVILLNMLDTPELKSKAEELYYKYRGFIKKIALYKLKNEDLAEDAVSDTMVELIKNIDRINQIDDYDTKAFVFIVIRNVCLNKYNLIKRQKEVSIEDYPALITSEQKAFEDVYLNDMYERILNLPEIYREILLLKFYYQLSNDKIASILFISPATVRKRLQRIRKIINEQEREAANV